MAAESAVRLAQRPYSPEKARGGPYPPGDSAYPGGVRPITLAREWNERGIPTVNGSKWHATTIKNMFTGPRIAGYVVYRGEILYDADGNKVRGQWEPILTDEEYEAVTAKWKPDHRFRPGSGQSGEVTGTVLPAVPVPAVREMQCRGCWADAAGIQGRGPVEFYRCPAKGQGGCGSLSRLAAPVNEYIKALVIAEQQKIQFGSWKIFRRGRKRRNWPTFRRVSKNRPAAMRKASIPGKVLAVAGAHGSGRGGTEARTTPV